MRVSVKFNPCIVLRGNYCRVSNIKANASAAYSNSRAISSFLVLNTPAQRNALYFTIQIAVAAQLDLLT